MVVSAMCGTTHHELGWVCERLRGHTGGHLATDPNALDTTTARRVSWPDDQPAAGGIVLDEDTGMVTLEPAFTADPRLLRQVRAIVSLVFVLLLLCSPAVIIAAYRAAL